MQLSAQLYTNATIQLGPLFFSLAIENLNLFLDFRIFFGTGSISGHWIFGSIIGYWNYFWVLEFIR